jgi:hypothetical protein
VLESSGIQFILVGGVAAVLNGAPILTYDVDIVYSQDADNVQLLLGLLQEVDGVFRIQPERRLRPTTSHLSGRGHLNLITSLGNLDLLSNIGPNLGYAELLPFSHQVEITTGKHIQVLGLEKLIEIKEQLGGEKDRAVLPILRRTLELSREQS